MAETGTNESRVVCENSQGLEIDGTIIHLGRDEVVFEVYSPSAVIQSSEVLREFKIELRDQTAYSGRAVVKNVVHTELKVVCAAALDGGWQPQFCANELRSGQMQGLFTEHLRQWQRHYRIRPEYKLHLADMESFFSELRLWLDQVDLRIRAASAVDYVQFQNDAAQELGASVLPSIDALFEKFEEIVADVEPADRPLYRRFMQQRLHPLLLCAPFVHRAYTKPLGYAGDYEIVNMIARNSPEGTSLFAKVANLYFVRQAPAIAHRNRLSRLTRRLVEESARVGVEGRPVRIFNLACGPAFELQTFLREHELSNRAEITLLDFNEETINYVTNTFRELKVKCSRRTPVSCVQRSVHQLLRESVRNPAVRGNGQQYDFVYCAGLFDYLTDSVCQRLITLLYEWLAPGGSLLITNVDATLNDLRSFRYSLEFLLDWHLIYRSSYQFGRLVPDSLRAESHLKSDETGVNLFLELRKPNDG